MANAPDSAAIEPKDRNFDGAALVRTAAWGIGAAAALFLAIMAGLTESAEPRVAIAVATLSGNGENQHAAMPVAPPVQLAAAQPQPSLQLVNETRRLNEQLRLLAADRDRLIQRVSALEENLEGLESVTGSIRQQQASTPSSSPSAPAPPLVTTALAVTAAPWPVAPPEQPAAAPWNAPAPPAVAPPPVVEASLPPATPLPPPRPAILAEPGDAGRSEAPAAKPVATRQATQPATQSAKLEAPAGRTAYGVDLGGGSSVDRLRLLWHSVRNGESTLLKGLRPVTQTRATHRGGRPDVRLIAGPLPSADDAAKLCAAILGHGRYCEPAVFHGQRLSSR